LVLAAQLTVAEYDPASVPVPPDARVATPPPKQATTAVCDEPVYGCGELVMEAVGVAFEITKFPAESPVAAE
jgi:hypothetical protein